MKNVRTIRKDFYDFFDRPKEDQNGEFLVVLNCKRCGGSAYARATWRDGKLALLARHHGSEKASWLSNECHCQDANIADMNFVDFETTVKDHADDVFPARMRLLAIVGLAAQALGSLRFEGGIHAILAMLLISAVFFMFGYFFFNISASGSEDRDRYYLSIAASTWLPAIAAFTFPT